jgi:hypothetical protein
MYVVKVIDRKRLAGAAGTGELTKVLLLLRPESIFKDRSSIH